MATPPVRQTDRGMKLFTKTTHIPITQFLKCGFQLPSWLNSQDEMFTNKISFYNTVTIQRKTIYTGT